MKRVALFTVVWIMLFSCDPKKSDQVPHLTKPGLKMIKDSTTVQLIDSVYNFGTITEGDKVEYKYRFKNIGKSPLIITDAHATCGCTVPEKPEEPLQPGETGSIKIVFNSQGKDGHQEKSIMVSSNANPAFKPLRLLGEVKAKETKK